MSVYNAPTLARTAGDRRRPHAAAGGAPSRSVLRAQCACGQNATAGGGECETCRLRKGRLQRSDSAAGARPHHNAAAPAAPPIVHDVLRSPGRTLGTPVRAFMEPRFGHDFSRAPARLSAAPAGGAGLTVGSSQDAAEREAERTADAVVRPGRSTRSDGPGVDFGGVRVHTDGRAAASARAVGALAYTVGQDVVFDSGRYAPDTAAGRRLLAHELAHVRQNQLAGGAPSSAPLRRYETPEHQDIGDAALTDLSVYLKTPEGAAWAKAKGIDPQAVADLPSDRMLNGGRIKAGEHEFTPGEVISLMGDFYRSPKAIADAPKAEVEELRAAIGNERSGKGGNANANYQEITLRHRKPQDSYLSLAKENKPHFTPDNRAAWADLHAQAIRKARQVPLTAAESRDALVQEALLYDAAGGHFLTDAFASGHVFDRAAVEDAIIRHLAANPARPANPELTGYYLFAQSQGIMHLTVLKNIHDRLNAEGVEVSNAKGMKWRTYGDNHLKNAPETSRIAALAVYLSRRQVMMASTPGTADPNPNEVLDLLPDDKSVQMVTAYAIKCIPDAVREVPSLLYAQRDTIKEGFKEKISGMPNIPILKPLLVYGAPALIESNLETIASPGRAKQLEEAQEAARRTGMPQPVPALTLGSW